MVSEGGDAGSRPYGAAVGRSAARSLAGSARHADQVSRAAAIAVRVSTTPQSGSLAMTVPPGGGLVTVKMAPVADTAT